MKPIFIKFLQVLIVTIGIWGLAFLLVEPLVEWRNAHATLSEVYLKDAFLAWAYATSLAFFVALYQAFCLLENIKQNGSLTLSDTKYLQTIKYCALILGTSVGLAVAYLVIVRPGDDIAGGVVIGTIITVCSFLVAIIANALGKICKTATPDSHA